MHVAILQSAQVPNVAGTGKQKTMSAATPGALQHSAAVLFLFISLDISSDWSFAPGLQQPDDVAGAAQIPAILYSLLLIGFSANCPPAIYTRQP